MEGKTLPNELTSGIGIAEATATPYYPDAWSYPLSPAVDKQTGAEWFERVERALADREQTKYWLATQLGFQPSRMTHWKAGRGKPDLHQAWRMAKLLDVPLEWLCDPGDAGEVPPARSEEERILLDAVRDIGPMTALRILVRNGLTAEQTGQAGKPVPIRSVEIKHKSPSQGGPGKGEKK